MTLPTSSPKTPEKRERVCPCGHGRGHHLVSIDAEYSAFAWFLMFFGISAQPSRLAYRCRKCDTIFDATTDPDVLRRHY